MKKAYFLFAAAIPLTSCGLTIGTGNNGANTPAVKTKSRIVQQVEAAGSGPVEDVSMDSLFKWLRDRMDLALKINTQCKEVRPTATAAWRDTPEGRICEVTGKLAAFRGQ